MKLKIKNVYLLILAICVVLSLGMTIQELPSNMYDQLQRQVSLNKQLRIQNGLLTEQVEVLTLTLQRVTRERNDGKYILYTSDMLTRGAVASRWSNPDHIRYVISICKKYEYLIADIRKTEPLACWEFILTRCIVTGLDPSFHSDKDGNGKWDTGIADLNDVCLASLQKDLPTHLKGRNWYNIEKSIAGLYVWIKQRNGHMPWAHDVNYDQWQYYARLKGVSDGSISEQAGKGR